MDIDYARQYQSMTAYMKDPPADRKLGWAAYPSQFREYIDVDLFENEGTPHMGGADPTLDELITELSRNTTHVDTIIIGDAEDLDFSVSVVPPLTKTIHHSLADPTRDKPIHNPERWYKLPRLGSLLAIAEPAPYGDIRTGQTVYNDDVRRCRQYIGHRVKYTQREVLSAIQPMFPGRKVHLKYNKINMYEPGGRFATHRDTPKKNVVGTLVLFGPQEFTGGELVLYDDGEETIVRDGWCAFYSSVPHEVRPVLSGLRVTVTFYIMQSDPSDSSDPSDPSDAEKADHIITDARSKMVPLIPDTVTVTPTPSPSPGPSPGVSSSIIEALRGMLPFGVVLREQYAYYETEAKGADANLLAQLSPHFLIENIPVLVVEDVLTESVDEDCDESTYTQFIYRFTPGDFLLDAGQPPNPPLPFSNIPFSTPEVYAKSALMYEKQELSISYVGNEAQDGIAYNTYCQRALLVSTL